MHLINQISAFCAADAAADDRYQRGRPHSDADIAHIKTALGLAQLNSLYEQIIRRFGNCFLGLELYALDGGNVIESTLGFRQLAAPRLGAAACQGFVAISDDGAGNPILIQSGSNQLYVYDHEAGEIVRFGDFFGDGVQGLDECIAEFMAHNNPNESAA